MTSGFSKLFLCVVCFITKCRVQYFAFTEHKVHVLLGCVYASSQIPRRHMYLRRIKPHSRQCPPCQISLKITGKHEQCLNAWRECIYVSFGFKYNGHIPQGRLL